jgi:hypothetical protein
MYIVNPYYDLQDEHSQRLWIEYFYYINDDHKHDSLFVQRCLNLHLAHICAQKIYTKHHIIWNDGCVAQFKRTCSWFYIGRHPSLIVCLELPHGCMFDWHYWGIGHGKGTHDGARACFKQCIKIAQSQSNGVKLHNAYDVTKFLRTAMNIAHATYPKARLEVAKNFIEIQVGEVDRQCLYSYKIVYK